MLALTSVTLLDKSCSLSLCINHWLWSHWIKFLYPPTPPTTLNMKTGQHRNENDKIGGISRKSLFPMNIHEMRSAVLQRKRATELFPAVSWIAIYIKAETVQIKHVWMQNQMSPRDKILLLGLPVTAGCLLLASGGGGGALIAKLVPLRASAAWVSAVATFSPARPC